MDGDGIPCFCCYTGAGAEYRQFSFCHGAAVEEVHYAKACLDAAGLYVGAVDALPNLPKFVLPDGGSIHGIETLRIGEFREKTGASHNVNTGTLLECSEIPDVQPTTIVTAIKQALAADSLKSFQFPYLGIHMVIVEFFVQGQPSRAGF